MKNNIGNTQGKGAAKGNLVVISNIAANIEAVDAVEAAIKGRILEIPLGLIKPSDKNDYTMDNINEMAQSLKAYGLLHNIVVREIDDTVYKYELISGERRFRGAGLAGWETIEAKVIEVNDADAEIRLIIANEEVRPSNDMVRARKVARLTELIEKQRKDGEDFGGLKTRNVVADQMHIPAAQVQKLKKLNELIPEIQKLVADGILGLETANQYAQMEPDMQLVVYNTIKQGMSHTAKEAKELKNKLQQVKDNEDEKQKIIDELNIKVQNFEADKEKAMSELKAKHDEELQKAQEATNNALSELQQAKADIEDSKKESDKKAEQLRQQILKELETQKGDDSKEQQDKLDELQRQLEEEQNKSKTLQGELDSIEKDNAAHIEKMEAEQKELDKEHEKQLKKVQAEFKEKEIKQQNVELNMELLALCKQANQLLATLVNKVATSKTLQGFEMTNEVKDAVANVAKFGNDISNKR